MRYGVIGDIHGNLPALETVLAALERERVDAYLCTGDLVGYGPFPNECVAAVEALGAHTVAGNHDLIVLGRLSGGDCIRLARVSLEWTRGVLTDSAASYLSRLPLDLEAPGAVVVAHGSLSAPNEYITDASLAARQRDLLRARWPEASTLLLGHTHSPAAWPDGQTVIDVREGGTVSLGRDGSWVLNPGAVGQSRERERRPRARCMVLDVDRREARYLALDYDVRACREALRRNGLSQRVVHLGPSHPVRAAAARARRAVRVATRR